MKVRNVSMFVLGAVMVTAATASAQARSQRPIRVSKDAPAEASAPRVDTVRVTEYRTDTLRMPGRVDTVRTMGMTRYDTVTMETMPMGLRNRGGLYFGIGAGEVNPHGALEIGQSAGYVGQVQVGWQPLGLPFGVRVDLNAARPGEERLSAGMGAHPTVLNVSGDAKIGLPLLNMIFGYPRFTFYGIGGVTWTRYNNLRIQNANQTATNQNPFLYKAANGTLDQQTRSNIGWNAGGGLSVGWAGTELFVEGRYLSFSPDGAQGRAAQIPLVVGFNFYP